MVRRAPLPTISPSISRPAPSSAAKANASVWVRSPRPPPILRRARRTVRRLDRVKRLDAAEPDPQEVDYPVLQGAERWVG